MWAGFRHFWESAHCSKLWTINAYLVFSNYVHRIVILSKSCHEPKKCWTDRTTGEVEGEGDRVDEGGEEKEPARGGGDGVEAEAKQPRLAIFILKSWVCDYQ